MRRLDPYGPQNHQLFSTECIPKAAADTPSQPKAPRVPVSQRFRNLPNLPLEPSDYWQRTVGNRSENKRYLHKTVLEVRNVAFWFTLDPYREGKNSLLRLFVADVFIIINVAAWLQTLRGGRPRAVD